jgi:predicted nuclease of predicted toxin-antitoxin system
MKARLYANENFPLQVVTALQQLGHDVLTTKDAGKSNEGIPDEAVLAFAISEKRAVLTHNRKDFIRLHHRDSNHEGIIVCTDNPNFAELAQKLDELLKSISTLRGQLFRVNRGH